MNDASNKDKHLYELYDNIICNKCKHKYEKSDVTAIDGGMNDYDKLQSCHL